MKIAVEIGMFQTKMFNYKVNTSIRVWLFEDSFFNFGLRLKTYIGSLEIQLPFFTIYIDSSIFYKGFWRNLWKR